MRILYAIQGTGNGHLSRARDIIPLLQVNNEVDILVSGTQAEIELPFPVKYKFKGLSFIFGKKGGVDVLETYKKSNLKVLYSEIKSLPVQNYDLVINDFEPVSAWACYQNKIMCISLSHQAAVIRKNAPQPKNGDIIGKAILKKYAPVNKHYGFHFKAYSDNIFTPVIRRQIREQQLENKGHFTVYLPAYDDERILKVLRKFKNTQWEIFSKHNIKELREKNISIRPIDNEAFIKSLATSEGVLCGAGFETPAEALFMKKKLMVIPMKGQYEQQCNAAALKKMGVPVLKSLKLKHIEKIDNWIKEGILVEVDYPDNTSEIIERILSENAMNTIIKPIREEMKQYSINKFRRTLLKKIAAEI